MVPISTLSKDKCALVTKILHEFLDIFTLPGRHLGRTDAVQHKIHVDPQVSPIRLPKRRLALKQQDIVTNGNEVQKNERQRRYSGIPISWSAPVVIVKKKDDTLNTLSGACYFCSLDLASGYWQVEMSAQSRQKTAFATREGLLEFTVMPFGLCNAPATFERLMD